jgi:bacteriorhodopsin
MFDVVKLEFSVTEMMSQINWIIESLWRQRVYKSYVYWFFWIPIPITDLAIRYTFPVFIEKPLILLQKNTIYLLLLLESFKILIIYVI